MKKILSVIITISMVAALAVSSVISIAAADETLRFSVTSAEAKPGDTVDIQLNMDENPGTYGLRLIMYHSDQLILRDVAYGNAIDESMFTESIKNKPAEEINPSGIVSRFDVAALKRNGLDFKNLMTYIVYAQDESSIPENITGTGTIVTFSFEIAETAPSGEYTVGISVTDPGFSIDVKTEEEIPIETTNGSITVTSASNPAVPETDINFGTPTVPNAGGSDAYYVENPPATSNPDDDTPSGSSDESNSSNPSETEKKDYAVVTDESGSIVYETDAEGNRTPKTEPVKDESTEKSEEEIKNDKENTVKTIVIIIGIVLICAGAAGIVYVFASKKSKPNDNEDDVKNGTSENNGSDFKNDIQNDDSSDNKENDDNSDENN